MGFALGSADVASDDAAHVPAVDGSLAADGVGLHVLVEELVRVQLRALGREKERLGLRRVSFEPALRPRGLVDRVPVDDEDFSSCVSYQASEELREYGRVELLLEEHEDELLPVRDRGDHVAPKALACAGRIGVLATEQDITRQSGSDRESVFPQGSGWGDLSPLSVGVHGVLHAAEGRLRIRLDSSPSEYHRSGGLGCCELGRI